MKQKCEKLKKQLTKNERYHAYLLNVYEENSQHFEEISAIISRYQTLKQTNLDLIEKQLQLIVETEKLQYQFSGEKKLNYNTQLSLNNDIAEQSKSLEERVGFVSMFEESLASSELAEIIKYRELMQIVYSVSNLYERCKKVLKREKSNKNQIVSSLTQDHYSPEKSSSNLNAIHKLTSQSATSKDGKSKEISITHPNMRHYTTVDEIRDETLTKLNEIGLYLCDFKDIVESISGQTFNSHYNYSMFNSVSSSNLSPSKIDSQTITQSHRSDKYDKYDKSNATQQLLTNSRNTHLTNSNNNSELYFNDSSPKQQSPIHRSKIKPS